MVGDNVSFGAGAVYLGPVRVGSNSIVGANSVVTRDVPENVIVFGVPAKSLKSDGEWKQGASYNEGAICTTWAWNRRGKGEPDTLGAEPGANARSHVVLSPPEEAEYSQVLAEGVKKIHYVYLPGWQKQALTGVKAKADAFSG